MEFASARISAVSRGKRARNSERMSGTLEKGKENSRHERRFWAFPEARSEMRKQTVRTLLQNLPKPGAHFRATHGREALPFFPPVAPGHASLYAEMASKFLMTIPNNNPMFTCPSPHKPQGTPAVAAEIASRSAPTGFLSPPACRNSDGPLHPGSLPRQSRVSPVLKPAACRSFGLKFP